MPSSVIFFYVDHESGAVSIETSLSHGTASFTDTKLLHDKYHRTHTHTYMHPHKFSSALRNNN